MSTSFVVLTTQRSGSTWLVDMLNSHPQVAAYSELFLDGARGRPRWGGAKDVEFWSAYAARAASKGPGGERALLFRYLDRLYAPRPGTAAIGFKLMYGQAGAHPALPEYFHERGVTVVHLIRRNVLDILLSKEAAVAREQFHARAEDSVPRVRLDLDTGKLVERLRWQTREVDRARERFAEASTPYLELFYEDLAADAARFDTLLEFLGVSRQAGSLESSLRVLNRATHRELIANYEAVRGVLQGTPYAAMLG